MLITLLIWLYMFGLCYVYGFGLLSFVNQLVERNNAVPDLPIPLMLFAGLAALTTFASYFSLFAPIGLIVNVILIAGALVLVLTHRAALQLMATRNKYPLIVISLLGLALLIVLENATHRPANPDTVIYHAQAIHWIEDFPVIPGLGNLHGRLAFNSSWFIANAAFSFAFLGGQSFHLAGSFIFLLFILYCWPGLTEFINGDFSLTVLLKTASIPLAFNLLGSELSSPGTDLPANLLIWLIILLWVEYIENPRALALFLIVLLSFFAVTIKLSTLPVLLLAIILFLQSLARRQWNQAALFATSAALVLLPFLIRNVILSGYLLYPYPAIDIFSFDWKVPAARATQERLSILAWGRLPRQNPTDVLAMPLTKWVPLWLSRQTFNRKLIAWAAVLSPLAALPLLGYRGFRHPILVGWLVMFVGTCFWLLTAPDFRFGYGFLIPAILLAGLPWLAMVFQNSGKYTRPVGGTITFLLGIFLALTLVNSFEIHTLRSRLVLPADYASVPTEPCSLANGQVFCAKSLDACSYQDFPCIPAPRPWVALLGSTFSDGFRSLR